MCSVLTNRTCRSMRNFLAFSLVVASLNGGVMAGASRSAGKSSASQSSSGKSATGLSSLPADAQGPISAALGSDDSGYWIHPNAEGFRGENPGQGLAAEFTQGGAEVRGQNSRWGLEARGYGYGDALKPVKEVAPTGQVNRVEYRRDGLTDWYENGPLGLEQGFTLAHSPGPANGQPLTVELALRGDLVAVLEPGGKSLALKRKNGKAALRYTGLQARDATGRVLRSWLEVRGERLLVRVEDSGARYPVEVDPWIQQAELTAADGAAGDNFGWSVAVSGNTAVVGAPAYYAEPARQGAAYVFVEIDGAWSQQAELTAPDGLWSNKFGSSVAISGSTVVVGAPWDTVGSNYQQGAAYVFVESGGVWSQQAELTASDGAAEHFFGTSVAVDGGTAVVGAPPNWSGGSTPPGAAYVFVQSGTMWGQQAELTGSDGDGRFGWSVGVDGSTAVVGDSSQEAVYVFAASGGTWSQQAKMSASDGVAGDNFGSSVAIGGTTAVVGAPWHHVANSASGAAYVFVASGGTWSQQAEVSASDGVAGDEFGTSVAVDGDTIVVGAPANFPWVSGPGTTYVFVESGGAWSQQEELTASDGVALDAFGWSVAVSGSTAVVGTWIGNVNSTQDQGTAYAFGSSEPPYALSAIPSTLTVVQGGEGTSTITITPANGFNGGVSFSASELPTGVTAAFNPNPATSTSTLTLTASGTAPPTGNAQVIVTGTTGSLTQITRMTLTVAPGTTVSLSPASLHFGNEAVNSTSAAKAVTLTNTGTARLIFSNITITLGASFTISGGNCGRVAAGKSCKVKVTFTPTQLGTETGTLSFTDNTGNSPQTVSLSGIGEVQATLTPATAAYAAQVVGTTSAAKTFTLANNQTVELTSIAISTIGDFAVSATTCGTSLAAKSKCTISLTFTPTATGTRTGQLSVSDSASNSPQMSSLKGTGK